MTFSSSLAREAGVAGYEKLPKSTLFKKIQEQFNIDRLQRAETRRKRCELKGKRTFEEEVPGESDNQTLSSQTSGPSAKRAKNCKKLNKIDPIMFAPIRKRHTWKFVRPNGMTKHVLSIPSYRFYLYLWIEIEFISTLQNASFI